ncbi:hypothetical protein Agabi119p4_4840 [Agaricus bisporus var. burnettii]|uniref:Uncharacterized protein n=1 Tax=Agaricus bisporus var. burnettii TaxID=192524 RepID=A0A8H7KHQ2_AGABI|nr:hypothetical protein Agabi119p4_4840 [Agaricus bisporus var. burnettii]
MYDSDSDSKHIGIINDITKNVPKDVTIIKSLLVLLLLVTSRGIRLILTDRWLYKYNTNNTFPACPQVQPQPYHHHISIPTINTATTAQFKATIVSQETNDIITNNSQNRSGTSVQSG